MRPKSIILIAAAVALFSASAYASPIGECTLKSNAHVNTLPTDSGQHLNWNVSKEISVAVRDTSGTEWVWVTGSGVGSDADPDQAVVGWTRRSSLKDCSWNRRHAPISGR